MANAMSTRAGTVEHVSLGTLMERSYRLYAPRLAVIENDRRTTYRDLGSRVHRIANALLGAGMRPGDRVAILSRNSTAFWEVEHALAIGGFIRVALTPRLHQREVEYIGNDCEPRVVFVDETWAELLPAVAPAIPSLERIVQISGQATALESLDGFLEGTDDAPAETIPSAGSVAALLYTSGTTGRPRGATLTHGNLVAMLRSVQTEVPPIDPSDVVLHVAPLTHMSGGCAFTYFTRGAMQTLLPAFDPRSVLETIERLRVTVIPLVPSMLNRLVEAYEDSPTDATSLRAVLYGGSPIAPDRLARAIQAFGEVFIQLYGLSEAVMPLAALSQRDHRLEADGSASRRHASAGRPHPFWELRIVDDDGSELPPGEEGEILVRGDNVMAGYWNDPEQTAAMIDADGWAHTGDVGRMDDEGYLTIVDRKRDMIVSGGFNVYPTEVENAILTLVGVREAAVVGAPDDEWGEAVTAVVVVRPGHTVTVEDVLQACRANLASYKAPKAVHFVDDLPKSGVGKILRREVRQGFWAGRDRQVG